MNRFWVPPLTAAIVALSVAAERPKQIKPEPAGASQQELKKLSGTFEIILYERDGQRATPEQLKVMKAVQKGAKWSFHVGGAVTEGIDRIHPGKKPKAVDATYTNSVLKGKKLLGIYEIDRDTIRYCYADAGKDRPKEFSTKPGSGLTLFIFKRVKSSK